MSKKKNSRGIGDNSEALTLYEGALAQAEAMLSKLTKLVGLADKEVAKSIFGKNINQRTYASTKAKGYLEKFELETKSWQEVIDAKWRMHDIHSAPIKTHKLEITGGEHLEFGQHIVNTAKTKSEVN